MRLCRTYKINWDASVDDIWHCWLCASLSSYLQQHMAAVSRICSKASFYVWDCVPETCNAEDVEQAKAQLPVPQPAQILPWLYCGDLDDAEVISRGGLRDRAIAAVLTLCPDDISDEGRASLAKGLAVQRIHHCEIGAQDAKTYDLADAVPRALAFVHSFMP